MHSPGRGAVTAPNGPPGWLASERRVGAEPKVCLPDFSLVDSR